MTNRARMPVRGVMALIVVLALGHATGCGSETDPSTPEGTLEALADAVSTSDDAAVAALICTEARGDDKSIAEAKALAVEADPKLADLRYEAQAGRSPNRPTRRPSAR